MSIIAVSLLRDHCRKTHAKGGLLMVGVHGEQGSFVGRRSRPMIYYEILIAIRHLWATRGEARVTPVQSYVNIPTGRFREFLHSMAKVGLIRLTPLDVTPAGNEYVEEFERFRKFLEKYGLAPRQSFTHLTAKVAQPHWLDIISEYEKKFKGKSST